MRWSRDRASCRPRRRPAPVRLAVVEAVSRAIRLGIADRLEAAGRGIEQMESGGHRDDQAARRADRDRSDVLGRRPANVLAARRIEPMDLAPLDADPVQHGRLRIPERALTEVRFGVQDASDPIHFDRILSDICSGSQSGLAPGGDPAPCRGPQGLAKPLARNCRSPARGSCAKNSPPSRSERGGR